MDIRNSKNTNTGNINTGGGNVHLGDNYFIKSADYQELKEREEELSDALKSAQSDEKRLKYSERLNKIRNEIKQLKKDVISLTETFLDIKLDTERIKHAKKFFEEGKFKEAGGSMEATAMTGDLESLLKERIRLQEEIKSNEEHLKDNANEFLIKAKLTAIDYKLEDRFEKTIDYYEMSIKAERNYENISSYATFLYKHDRHIESERYHQEAVEIVRKLSQEDPLTHLPELAKSLNLLGEIQRVLDHLDQAERSYQEALEICRNLTDDGQNTHLIELGEALHSIGVVFRLKNEFKKAKIFLEEALAVRSTLAEDNSEESLDNLANTLNSLAVLLYSMGKGKMAKVRLQEAIEMRRKLSEVNPDEFLGRYAHLLTNNGDLQFWSNRVNEGRQSFQEAIKFFRELSETNPQQYLSELAAALVKFAKNLVEDNDSKVLEKAEEFAHEALSIYRNLAEFNGASWLDEVADSLLLLVRINVKQHKSEEAEIFLQEGLEIYRDLCESNPIFIESYVEGLDPLVSLYKKLNERAKAQEIREEISAISKKII